jgi:hypothetical protein
VISIIVLTLDNRRFFVLVRGSLILRSFMLDAYL